MQFVLGFSLFIFLFFIFQLDGKSIGVLPSVEHNALYFGNLNKGLSLLTSDKNCVMHSDHFFNVSLFQVFSAVKDNLKSEFCNNCGAYVYYVTLWQYFELYEKLFQHSKLMKWVLLVFFLWKFNVLNPSIVLIVLGLLEIIASKVLGLLEIIA